jgi:endonuclease/exonuclease/phosphatase family metal-dependent hydrolase
MPPIFVLGQFRTPIGLLAVAATLALLAIAWWGAASEDAPACIALTAATAAALASFLVLPRCGRAMGYRLPFAALVVACCAASLATLGAIALSDATGAAAAALAIALAILAVAILAKLWVPLTGLRHRLAEERGPALARPGAPRRVRVASWNVFLRVLVADRLLENDAKEARVDGIGRRAAETGADVVCLQECNATFNFRVHRLLEGLHRRGYPYAAVPRRPPLLSPCAWIDSGLVTASRLPIARVHSTELPAGASVDRLMAKGAQCCDVRGGPGVVNVHLQADYALPENGAALPTSRARVRQLRALRGFVDRQRSQLGRPVVVCGDMNGDRRPELRLEATSTADLLGMRDPWAARPPTSFECFYDAEGREVQGPVRRLARSEMAAGRLGPSHNAHGALTCIARSTDYILADRSLGTRRARVLPGPPLSDHNLLAADALQ